MCQRQRRLRHPDSSQSCRQWGLAEQDCLHSFILPQLGLLFLCYGRGQEMTVEVTKGRKVPGGGMYVWGFGSLGWMV